jgi:hypothetical protein
MDQPRARALLAVDQLLRARWAALQRAEARLAAGSYGRSVRSGQAIPDERLEADPLAELTVQEAAATERSTVEEADDGVGLVSASHPFEVLADADITPEEEQASEENDDEPAPTAEPGHPHRARPAAPVAGSAASLSTAITPHAAVPETACGPRGIHHQTCRAAQHRTTNPTFACSAGHSRGRSLSVSGLFVNGSRVVVAYL